MIQESRWFPLLFLCACGGATSDSGEVIGSKSFENEGKACLAPIGHSIYDVYGWGNPDEVTLAADQAPTVWVVFQSCIDLGARNTSQSCEATLDGTTLAVTAKGRFDLHGGSAASSCSPYGVECEAPALSEGTWTLAYGGGTTDITMPYTGVPPCAQAAR